MNTSLCVEPNAQLCNFKNKRFSNRRIFITSQDENKISSSTQTLAGRHKHAHILFYFYFSINKRIDFKNILNQASIKFQICFCGPLLLRFSWNKKIISSSITIDGSTCCPYYHRDIRRINHDKIN